MEQAKKENAVNRRSFLKSSTLSGLAALVPKTALAFAGDDEKSTVVIVEDSEATNGTDIVAATVQEMMNSGILALTGLNSVGEAWQSLLPGLTSSSVIAIKVNCRSSALPTHPEVSNAVVAGLKMMVIDGEGYNENNIHIYDNAKAYLEEAGYTVNKSSEGVRCYMATEFSNQSYSVNGISQRVCTVVHDTADYLINIGVLKNHYSMAGVTLCMKNHFGSIDQPRRMHINAGDPYIGALNAIDPIKDKQVINILDGLLGASEGGPYGAATFVANKIIMSTDPVAVDYLGREILIEQESSTASMATYIDSAANYGIGTNDPRSMNIIHINNSPVGITDPTADRETTEIRSYPNPFSDQTTFEFWLNRQQDVCLEIYSALGIKVRTLVQDTLPAGQYQLTWKGDNQGGIRVQKGLYVCKFSADETSKSFVIIFK